MTKPGSLGVAGSSPVSHSQGKRTDLGLKPKSVRFFSLRLRSAAGLLLAYRNAKIRRIQLLRVSVVSSETGAAPPNTS